MAEQQRASPPAASARPTDPSFVLFGAGADRVLEKQWSPLAGPQRRPVSIEIGKSRRFSATVDAVDGESPTAASSSGSPESPVGRQGMAVPSVGSMPLTASSLSGLPSFVSPVPRRRREPALVVEPAMSAAQAPPPQSQMASQSASVYAASSSSSSSQQFMQVPQRPAPVPPPSPPPSAGQPEQRRSTIQYELAPSFYPKGFKSSQQSDQAREAKFTSSSAPANVEDDVGRGFDPMNYRYPTTPAASAAAAAAARNSPQQQQLQYMQQQLSFMQGGHPQLPRPPQGPLPQPPRQPSPQAQHLLQQQLMGQLYSAPAQAAIGSAAQSWVSGNASPTGSPQGSLSSSPQRWSSLPGGTTAFSSSPFGSPQGSGSPMRGSLLIQPPLVSQQRATGPIQVQVPRPMSFDGRVPGVSDVSSPATSVSPADSWSAAATAAVAAAASSSVGEEPAPDFSLFARSPMDGFPSPGSISSPERSPANGPIPASLSPSPSPSPTFLLGRSPQIGSFVIPQQQQQSQQPRGMRQIAPSTPADPPAGRTRHAGGPPPSPLGSLLTGLGYPTAVPYSSSSAKPLSGQGSPLVQQQQTFIVHSSSEPQRQTPQARLHISRTPPIIDAHSFSGAMSPGASSMLSLSPRRAELDEEEPLDDGDGEGRRKDSSDVPMSKQGYRQFYKQFKQREEEEGFQGAVNLAYQSLLQGIPSKLAWRVFLEIADMAKRENDINIARGLYKLVSKIHPQASQAWLEYAKMEEECGHLEKCRIILRNGMRNCWFSETLVSKAIKLEEKMGDLTQARALLGMVKDMPIEKSWRTVLEGALLEARAARTEVARAIFGYLMRNVPWYGPIFQEAFRFEERCEENTRAMDIIRRGLDQNPKYGPLWFSALRHFERMSPHDLSYVRGTAERAALSVSKELTWKVFLELAQVEERAGEMERARAAFVRSVTRCPANLLWKVWLSGARMELVADRPEVARALLKRALKEVPSKMRPVVLLEYSRLEEYLGNTQASRRILEEAKRTSAHEWKVYLECVLLEIRANNPDGALKEVVEALDAHPGTGRLWAMYIQLKQKDGPDAQMKVFMRALKEVPKSGEVWCEGARIQLDFGNYKTAHKYLDFAVQFTPQYGDSFVEYLRGDLMSSMSFSNSTVLEHQCVNAEPNYGPLWLYCKRNALDTPRQVLRNAKKLLLSALKSGGESEDARRLFNVNYLYQRMQDLDMQERRKLIFGSDQVKL